MSKKIFIFVGFALCIMSTPQASYNFQNLNFYGSSKKSTPKKYHSFASSSHQPNARKLFQKKRNYQGLYGSIGSALHIPFPQFSTNQQSFATSKEKNGSSSYSKGHSRRYTSSTKIHQEKNDSYSSLAIPFNISPSEQKILCFEKYLLPFDLHVGYRFSEYFAIEGSFSFSLPSTDAFYMHALGEQKQKEQIKLRHLFSLTSIVAKFIYPYNKNTEGFVNIGCIIPYAQYTQEKSTDTSKSGTLSRHKRKASITTLQDYSSKHLHRKTWVASLGANYNIRPTININASLNVIGSLNSDNQNKKYTQTIYVTESRKMPIFFRVFMNYKFL